VGTSQRRRLIWAVALALATAAVGAALTSTTAAAGPAVTTSSSTIATGAGPRPLHMVRIVPGRGVRLQAVWLGGGPGRTGTVGAYIRANAGRGAVAGLNGDFFLLGRNVPSGNLLIHKGRSFLGGTNRGAAAFGVDGSVDIVPGNVKDTDLVEDGVREAISGKPVYVHDGRLGDLTTLEPYQRDLAYHRTAVGRLRNGQTALVVVGGAGTTASQFAQALIQLGFVEALGMDIDSSANVNWRGASLNRPDYQRLIPTGIIAFRSGG
jgi:phosphodiester glycosidase